MAFTADTGYPIRESVGSMTMLIYSATDVTDASTVSLPGFSAKAYWGCLTENGGASEEGVNIYHSPSTTGSTLTIWLSTTSSMMLYVMGE